MATSTGALSGTSSPYQTATYSPQANDKNTLSMTGYFQLLATQLQNQDMTNPMDNSELMAQMTQMAMVQSLTTMTDTMKNATTINTQTYAASLVGQKVTMAVTEENSYGQETPVDVKYATVEWVNFTSGSPTIKLEGDPKEYSLTHLVGMGEVPNPYKNKNGESSGTDMEPGGTGEPQAMSSAPSGIGYSARTRASGDDEDDRTSGVYYDSDAAEEVRRVAARIAATKDIDNLNMESIQEARRAVKELAQSGAYSSPDQIPDLTITR